MKVIVPKDVENTSLGVEPKFHPENSDIVAMPSRKVKCKSALNKDLSIILPPSLHLREQLQELEKEELKTNKINIKA